MDAVEPKILDQLLDYAQDLYDTLADIDPSLLSGVNRRLEDDREEPHKLFGGGFERSSHFELLRSLHIGGDEAKERSARRRGAILAQRVHNEGRRLQANSGGACVQKCEVDDEVCIKNKLGCCAKKLSVYDLMVLHLDGYIVKDMGSEKYGNLTVDASELNTFNFESPIDRWNEIQSGQTLFGYLNKLVTVCNPFEDTCSEANEQTYHVSVDQVGFEIAHIHPGQYFADLIPCRFATPSIRQRNCGSRPCTTSTIQKVSLVDLSYPFLRITSFMQVPEARIISK